MTKTRSRLGVLVELSAMPSVMRALFLSLTLLSPPALSATCTDLSPNGQLPTQSNAGPVLCNRFYAAQQSLEAREPLWSAEHLTEESVERAMALQGRAQFHVDSRIPNGQRAELSDYKRSGWSRGHMTPSGDAPDQFSRYETYALSNVVPQSAALNTGPWNKIERSVRNLAQQDGEVYVVTGPAFRENVGTIGASQVRVPSSIWKAVYDPASGGVAVIVCKNNQAPTCGEVPLAALIRVTGIDPFPGISASEKEHPVLIHGWPQ